MEKVRGSPGNNWAETKSDRDKNWTIKLSPAIIQFEVWKLRDKSSGHWHVPTGRKNFLQKTNSCSDSNFINRCAYEQLWLSVQCSLLVVFYFNQMVSGFSLSPAHLVPLVNDSWLLWECFTWSSASVRAPSYFKPHFARLWAPSFDKSFPCAIFAQGGRFNSMLWRGFRSFLGRRRNSLSLEHSARMKFYPRPDLSPGHNAWVYVNLSSCVCLVSLFYSTLSLCWCPVTRHESGCK